MGKRDSRNESRELSANENVWASRKCIMRKFFEPRESGDQSSRQHALYQVPAGEGGEGSWIEKHVEERF